MNDTQNITLAFIGISIALLVSSFFLIIYFAKFYRLRFISTKEKQALRESFDLTLTQAKLEIQEETLAHISRELHANFGHIVSLININLTVVLPQIPREIQERVIETKSLAKQLMKELKGLSVSLNTDHIRRVGFQKAFENVLGNLGTVYYVNYKNNGGEYMLHPDQEIILFRICQEIIDNIVKHSGANSINVEINYAEKIRICIADDGIGFDFLEVMKLSGDKQSTGLRNIYKRAQWISADVIIYSTPGKGTMYTVSIFNPINEIVNGARE